MASYKQIRIFYPVWLWGIIITAISLLPGKTMPDVSFWKWIAVDKIGHFAVYAIWVVLLLQVSSKSGYVSKRHLTVGLVFIMAYGVFLEVLQRVLYLGRFFEFSDIVANCIGVLFGAGTYFFLLKRF